MSRGNGTTESLQKQICCLKKKIRALEIINNDTTNITASIVWRPGGTLGNGVYTTEAEVWAVVDALQVDVEVQLDTTNAPAQIAGVRDATRIRWTPFSRSLPQPVLQVLSTGRVTNFSNLGFVEVQLFPSGAPVLLYPNPYVIVMDLGASMDNLGSTEAIIYTTATAPLVFALTYQSRMLASGGVALVNLQNSGFLVVSAEDLCTFGAETVSGTPGSFLVEQYTVGTVRPQSLSGFSGFRSLDRFPPALRRMKYVAALGGDDASGDGTEERPYQTIERALQDDLGEAMVIRLLPGTYAGVVIPSSPARASLTIEGHAALSTEDVLITSNPNGYGFELTPAAADAPFFRTLVLRNLNIQGNFGAVRVINSGPVNTFLESLGGLWIENCFLLAGVGVALEVERGGVINLMNNKIGGDVELRQTSRGTAINNEQLFGTWNHRHDATALQPIGGLAPFYYKSCRWLSVLVDGAPNVVLDSGCRGDLLSLAPNDYAGSAFMTVRCEAKFVEFSCMFLQSGITTHDIVLDQSKLPNFNIFFDAPPVPATIRQPVTFLNGVSSTIVVDEKIDLYSLDTTADVFIAGGVGVDQGAIDRRRILIRTNLSVVPTNVTIDPPLPAGAAYEASVVYNALPGIAVTTQTNPAGGAQVTHQSTAGVALESASLLLTRYP